MVDAAGDLLRLGPNDRDGQHAVPQRRLMDLNAVSEEEAALELPRGDSAMQELTRPLVPLPAAHEKLVVLGEHLDIVSVKPATAIETRNFSVPSASIVRSIL
jgi:hypothetical protein